MAQAPVLAAGEHAMTIEERRNQRNAVLAGFLGWTLDAFDYFVLTFVIADIARSFGRSTPDIALTLTLALARLPVPPRETLRLTRCVRLRQYGLRHARSNTG